MHETEKIWMNGEFVDWADAKVHVGVHGLHYGTGVFEGIRCYETPEGPGGLPAQGAPAAPAQLGPAALHGAARTRSTSCAPRRTSWSAATGLPECYIRPIAFYGYGELGVHTAGNPVEIVIMSWPWGNYLGDESAEERHPHQDLLLEARRPEHDPARLQGDRASTSTRCSPSTRRGAPATTRRSCSPTRATSPTARARTSSSSRTACICTPPLSTSILPGITRDSVIQIAQDLGYVVEEANLIRTDLYLADEIFMTGTAAEVTPVRSVDDHEIGVGPGHARAAEGVPRHGARRERALGALARARAEHGASRAPRREAPTTRHDPALGAVARRAGRGARARGAPLGPALARACDRPLRGAVRGDGRRALCGRGVVRHRRAALLCAIAGVGPATR